MATTPLHLRWLWWKHTWHFQAAHKPLCARFHRDVLRIGRLHLCRSCTALYGGLALSLLLAPFYHHWMTVPWAVTVSALLGMVILASGPARYRGASRLTRDILRSGLGVLVGLSVVMLTTPLWPLALLHVGLLVVIGRFYQGLRHAHGRNADGCAGCPERHQPGICAGFQKQAEYIRAYEESATDWLERTMTPPSRLG